MVSIPNYDMLDNSIEYFNYNNSFSSDLYTHDIDLSHTEKQINENNGDNGINKENGNNKEYLKDKDIINENEDKSKSLLGHKHSIKFEDEDKIDNMPLEPGKDNIKKDDSQSISPVHIKKIGKVINDNKMKDNDMIIDQQNLNLINSESNDNNCRANQKDNFSQKLFKKINDFMKDKIKELIPENYNIKLYKPKYDIFTHNTNLLYIYFFLDIKYKILLSLNSEDIKALDKLLCKLKLKKKYKKKETTLSQKEIENAKKLFKSCGYEIDENKQTIDDYKNYIMDFLKKNNLKNIEDTKLYKSDKKIIDELLIKKGLLKTYKLQKKNKEEINKIENENELNQVQQLLDKTLREIIIDFYYSEKFYKFSKEVQNIDKNFQTMKSPKKLQYSLLDKENNGFIRMVEDDCGLNPEKKDKIRKLIAYFNEGGLNAEKIKEYEEDVFPKDKETFN